jgi:hypothetical protein
MVGLFSSYRIDLPSGPAVVTSLGIALLLCGLLYYITHAPKKRYAALKVLAGTALVGGVIAGLAIFTVNGSFMHIEHHHEWETNDHTADHTDTLRRLIIDSCGEDASCATGILGDRPEWTATVRETVLAADPDLFDWWIELLGKVDLPGSGDILVEMAGAAPDALQKLAVASALVDKGDQRGSEITVDILDSDAPPLVLDEAHQVVIGLSGDDFGFDPFAEQDENSGAVRKMRAWLKESGNRNRHRHRQHGNRNPV